MSNFKQVVHPNPHIPCEPGWCLQYVRQAFGLPARYGSATEAWFASSSQHRDRNYPKGVWFAVWWALDKNVNGHVALVAPDGSVYSTSSLKKTPYHHPNIADVERYYAHYGMALTYRGWTEDVAGYPVIAPIEEEDDLMATPDQRKALIQELMDTQVDQQGGGKNSLRELLAESRPHHLDVVRVVGEVPAKTLNKPIARGGVMGGETTLGGMVAWNDEHVIQTLAAVAASAANDGASVDEIAEAVKAKIADGITVRVEVVS